MKKYYVDTRGRKFRLRRKIVAFSALYFYADMFDDLRENIKKFLDDDTNEKLWQISLNIHNQIGHIDCDVITNMYVIEEGYNNSDLIR